MPESYAGLLAGGVLLGLSIAAPIGPVNVAMIQRGLREGFAGTTPEGRLPDFAAPAECRVSWLDAF
jgi:hypothetical protein